MDDFDVLPENCAEKPPAANNKNQEDSSMRKKNRKNKAPRHEYMEILSNQATLALEALEDSFENDAEGLQIAKAHITRGLHKFSSGTGGWMKRGMNYEAMHRRTMLRVERMRNRASVVMDSDFLQEEVDRAMQMLQETLEGDPDGLFSAKTHITTALQDAMDGKINWMACKKDLDYKLIYERAMKKVERNRKKLNRRMLKEGGGNSPRRKGMARRAMQKKRKMRRKEKPSSAVASIPTSHDTVSKLSFPVAAGIDTGILETKVPANDAIQAASETMTVWPSDYVEKNM